ncbi:MAG TPA: S26 family signal peptidase [Sphingopyxis sp.]|nr:S26 family signal peptidase [Sphingopyxis sp.]
MREGRRLTCNAVWCRFRVPVLALIGLAGALAATVVSAPAPRLVWNVSASAPRGLYAVSPAAAIARGDTVIAWVPSEWRRLAALRRYIPINVPLVKRVAAGPGDRVCADGIELRVNERWAAARRDLDGRGREMPAWEGCVTLGAGCFLLLNDAPDSFDGRYFGPTGQDDIVGKARLLWRA